jgi:hypothetical protein
MSSCALALIYRITSCPRFATIYGRQSGNVLMRLALIVIECFSMGITKLSTPAKPTSPLFNGFQSKLLVHLRRGALHGLSENHGSLKIVPNLVWILQEIGVMRLSRGLSSMSHLQQRKFEKGLAFP